MSSNVLFIVSHFVSDKYSIYGLTKFVCLGIFTAIPKYTSIISIVSFMSGYKSVSACRWAAWIFMCQWLSFLVISITFTHKGTIQITEEY